MISWEIDGVTSGASVVGPPPPIWIRYEHKKFRASLINFYC